MDPLQALTAALSVPADSKEQAELLTALRETLEAQPHPIPILCNTLLKTAAGSNDSLLRRWVLDLLHFGIARAPLAVDARTNRASSFSSSSPPPTPVGLMTHSRARMAIVSISSRAPVSGHPGRSIERR
jgi:hypothetical protein